MKCVFVCVVVFLVTSSYQKEDVAYELKGGDLFDLVRGRPPKDGFLKVEKVENNGDGKMKDGIFFIPEDVLDDEPKELYIKRKQPEDIESPENL